MMYIPDPVIAVVAVLLLAAGVGGYFLGAKRQLESCLAHRDNWWSDDEGWKEECDILIAKKRY